MNTETKLSVVPVIPNDTNPFLLSSGSSAWFHFFPAFG
jgi:hypothetical protein